MATRTITTTITLDQEAQFKKEMAAVNGELRNLKSEMTLVEETFRDQADSVEALEAKQRVLRKEVEQQEEKVRALQRAVDDGTEAYADAPEKVDKYQQSLNRAKAELIKMTRALDDNEAQLEQARKSSDDYADALDDLGRGASDAGGGMQKLSGTGSGIGGFISQLGKLKGALMGGAVVGSLVAVKDAIFDIVESTAEYRKIMGTLEISSEAAGYTAEETSETYNRLYAVIGDTQAAAEATTQLQALGMSQEDLNFLTDATIGAWTALGQSAPIESIAEAVQQTINAGTATGAFSDLLVAAGISEDGFNEKLAEANTKAERANIVMTALADEGMADLGQAWYDNNEDLVDMNESTAKWQEAMGKMGEVLAPVAADLLSFGADVLGVLAGWLDTLIQKTADFMGDLQDMNQAARDAGTSLTGQGFNFDFVRNPDGSHADGLAYVPYDGYLAELHEGERVLTAAENRMLAAMGADLSTPAGVTAAQLQQIMVASVGAMAAGQKSGGDVNVTAVLELDGETLARKTFTHTQREAARHGTSLVKGGGA